MGILETICEARLADVAKARSAKPLSSLLRRASTPRRAFARASVPFLIAECKRASPSRGLMVPDYDPAALALAYEAGGAGVVSVLTEERHFQGSRGHLVAVRDAVGLPVLRKDFMVDAYQLRESWAMGADAILLIVAAIDRTLLFELAAGARELGLSILVEVKEPSEIETALAAAPDAIGVNARDLRDFSVDAGKSAAMVRELAAQAPPGLVMVAESGMKEPADAAALRLAGYDGFLVGEALATSERPGERTRAFVAAIAAAGMAAIRQARPS
ncbi:MAG: indole-3-glycerol phosphate synthase TrpC [Rectinemataceae bacterium]